MFCSWYYSASNRYCSLQIQKCLHWFICHHSEEETETKYLPSNRSVKLDSRYWIASFTSSPASKQCLLQNFIQHVLVYLRLFFPSSVILHIFQLLNYFFALIFLCQKLLMASQSCCTSLTYVTMMMKSVFSHPLRCIVGYIFVYNVGHVIGCVAGLVAKFLAIVFKIIVDDQKQRIPVFIQVGDWLFGNVVSFFPFILLCLLSSSTVVVYWWWNIVLFFCFL